MVVVVVMGATIVVMLLLPMLLDAMVDVCLYVFSLSMCMHFFDKNLLSGKRRMAWYCLYVASLSKQEKKLRVRQPFLVAAPEKYPDFARLLT